MNCHGNRVFIVIGVFPVELLAYQVSMVCDANMAKIALLYTSNNIGRMYGVISHLICIFFILFKQLNLKGRRCSYENLDEPLKVTNVDVA